MLGGLGDAFNAMTCAADVRSRWLRRGYGRPPEERELHGVFRSPCEIEPPLGLSVQLQQASEPQGRVRRPADLASLIVSSISINAAPTRLESRVIAPLNGLRP